MFSLSKHLKTQAGQVVGTVQSIGNGGLKMVGVTGTDVGKKSAAAERPPARPIPTRDTERGTRILSLDGGGVRGYSALLILDDFMKRVNKKLQDKHEAANTGKPFVEVIPADFFDLIIGTSTGGVMALMLGRMRMSVGECIDAYQALSRKIFGGGVASTVLSGGLLGKGPGLGLGMGVLDGRDLDNYVHLAMSSAVLGEPAMYDAAKMEKHVKRTIENQEYTWAEPDTMLEEKNKDNCHTAVVAACQANATTPHLMRSYYHEDYPNSEKVKIWEAARATSAAPAFFAPIEIGANEAKIAYVDGAVTGHCNPTTLAREEAEFIWRDPQDPSKPKENILLLSLGTGAPSAISLSGQLPQKLVGFIGLTANAVHTAEASTRYYNQRYDKNSSPYVRISVPDGINDVRLDDYSKMSVLASATATYLLKEEAKNCLVRAVELGLGEAKPVHRERKSTVDMGILTPPQSPPTAQSSINTPPQSMSVV